MSDNDSFEYKDSGLDAILKAMEDKLPVAKVGILGDKNQREGDNSNAEVGARAEFGIGVDQRSFLRTPIIENFQKYLDKAMSKKDKDDVKEIIKEKSLISFVKRLGVIGEAVVLDAFDTGGFGKWKPSNMKYKKNHQTLVETQQLRNSITSEIEE